MTETARNITLAIHDLAIGYRGRVVADGIGFKLTAGEVLCVLGRNGGGKSTLFRTILGLQQALAGRIEMAGEDVSGWGPRKRARAFGYVPQSGAGQFAFTVLEMVMMGRTAHRGAFAAPTQADREACAQALDALGIAPLADRDWLRVSGGERQLALIARALAQEPRLMILDEPTASLDLGNQAQVLGQVRALAGRGLSVIFSTHQPEQAFACADRVALLHEGRLSPPGAPDAVITPERMREVYGVEVAVVPVTADGRLRVCVPI